LLSTSAEDPFEIVRTLGLRLADVRAAMKYDGSPVLKRGGKFVAGIAAHPSAEPNTLVIRSDKQNRDLLIDEAPEIYYVTDHYRKHPVVLVRLSHIDEDSLRELLTVSWRLSRNHRELTKRGKADRVSG